MPSLDSKLILFDAESGEFKAIMDANWITAMRTGAVAAHSIRLLARPGWKTLGVMGLGNTARAALLVLAEMEPERTIHVKLLKHKGQEASFAERFTNYTNLVFTEVETCEEMIRGSEVIVSGATYLPDDVCGDDSFDEGVLVVPIHTLGFTNCDLFFDKVFADDFGHVRHFKNFDKFKSFAETCDVVNGLEPGRENDSERILAYNIGVSTQDVTFAAHLFNMLQERNLPELEFKEPVERFWV